MVVAVSNQDQKTMTTTQQSNAAAAQPFQPQPYQPARPQQQHQQQQYMFQQSSQLVRVPTCDIHRDMQAITKCESCNKNLCLNCRVVYRRGEGHEGYGSSDYCSECREQKRSARLVGMVISFIVALLIMAILAAVIFGNLKFK